MITYNTTKSMTHYSIKNCTIILFYFFFLNQCQVEWTFLVSVVRVNGHFCLHIQRAKPRTVSDFILSFFKFWQQQIEINEILKDDEWQHDIIYILSFFCSLLSFQQLSTVTIATAKSRQDQPLNVFYQLNKVVSLYFLIY